MIGWPTLRLMTYLCLIGFVVHEVVTHVSIPACARYADQGGCAGEIVALCITAFLIAVSVCVAVCELEYLRSKKD